MKRVIISLQTDSNGCTCFIQSTQLVRLLCRRAQKLKMCMYGAENHRSGLQHMFLVAVLGCIHCTAGVRITVKNGPLHHLLYHNRVDPNAPPNHYDFLEHADQMDANFRNTEHTALLIPLQKRSRLLQMEIVSEQKEIFHLMHLVWPQMVAAKTEG